MKLKFGTDGWRAVMAEEFTFHHVRFLTQAVARYLRSHELSNRGVVIGYDTRFQSEQFAKAIVEVLTGADIRCWLVDGDAPTPVVAFAVKEKNAGAGMMVTASHNPACFNGIKLLNEYGGPADSGVTAEIEENMSLSASDEKIFTLPFDKAEETGKVELIEPQALYFKKIRELVDFETIRKAGLSVIYDPIYGTGRNYVDHLLVSEGVKVKVLHNYRDPLFGGMQPDPSPLNLRQLVSAVKTSGADVGLATDGDGDRFGVVDSLGNIMSPNEILAILFWHFIKRRKMNGKAIRSVATTHLFDRIGKHFGVEVLEVPVGFKYISQHILRDDIMIGADEAGGLSMLGHIPGKDGILACLLVAEVCAIEGKPLTTVLQEIMSEVGELYSSRIDLRFREVGRKEEILTRLKDEHPTYISGLKVVDSYDIDGMKYILGDGSWVMVRSSGTEPLLRVYLEGSGRDILRRLERFADELVK